MLSLALGSFPIRWVKYSFSEFISLEEKEQNRKTIGLRAPLKGTWRNKVINILLEKK